jgi:hypothetical protein
MLKLSHGPGPPAVGIGHPQTGGPSYLDFPHAAVHRRRHSGREAPGTLGTGCCSCEVAHRRIHTRRRAQPNRGPRSRKGHVRSAEEENVRTHFEKLALMRERLASLGKIITDTEYTNILIRSLLPFYDNVLRGLNDTAQLTGTAIGLKTVIHLAGGEYDRCTLKKSAQGADEDFVAGSSQKGKKKRDIQCFN